MHENEKNFKRFLLRNEQYKEQTQGAEATKKQYLKSKLTASERLDILFDKDTFFEIDKFVLPIKPDFGKESLAYGDGVLTGVGMIMGRQVFVFAQDFNILGGSLGYTHAKKIQKIQDMALKTGSPIVGLIDSGGAKIQDGITSLGGYAGIFHRNVQSSGVITQISVVMGPAAGGAVYSPALTDFVFMTDKTSYMFVTGPNVVKEVLNEEVNSEDLGGAMVHAKNSGVAQFVFEDEENTLKGVRKLLSFLPSNNLENPPYVKTKDIHNRTEEKLRDIIPSDPNKSYDVKNVIELIIDDGRFFEVSKHFAQNIVIGFARLNGNSIGIVANQPKVLAGTLDIASSMKAARFVRYCDCFNIPILAIEDVPGFMPGLDQEHNGIIKHGAKLLYAFSEATVPRITLILRKAYGGAYCVMNSKDIGSDFNFAWPTAEIAVMGSEGAVIIIYKRELAASEDPVKLKKELVEKYRSETANPFVAEEKGFIDEVIDPAETRNKLILAFEITRNKAVIKPNRKHGNIPL